MTRRLRLLVTLAVLTAFAPAQQPQSPEAVAYDVLIRNGRVVDGHPSNGGPGSYNATVAVKDGHIVKIDREGALKDSDATRVIDATGMIVAPGFIDTHMHVETSLPRHPGAENLIRDGVTSIVTGNCGGSAEDLGQWFAGLEKGGISLNVASLVGHNTVRRRVMGEEDRAPTEEELVQMVALVEQAMKDGAVGFSTGLIYVPGTYSDTDEVVALARAAAKHGGLYASHMRDEADKIFEAIDEALEVGSDAGMPVQISHFKLASKPMWGRSNETLTVVENARKAGLDVTLDQYPYTASSTRLDVLVPSWALAGGRAAFRRRAGNPAERNTIAAEMNERKGRLAGWDDLGWAVVASAPWDGSLNGKSIREINQTLYRRDDTFADQVETVIDMVAKGRVQMVYHMMSEDDVRRILAHPLTMIGRDGGVQVPGNSKPHPRSYGSAARILGRYVREEAVLSLPQAVRKLAALPAERFGFADRGYIKEGYWADIVIFDPEKVSDAATFERPHQYSRGIPYVMVNGQLVVDNGQPTLARPGKILRNQP